MEIEVTVRVVSGNIVFYFHDLLHAFKGNPLEVKRFSAEVEDLISFSLFSIERNLEGVSLMSSPFFILHSKVGGNSSVRIHDFIEESLDICERKFALNSVADGKVRDSLVNSIGFVVNVGFNINIANTLDFTNHVTFASVSLSVKLLV